MSAPVLSIEQQATLVNSLLRSCTCQDGETAGVSWVRVSKVEADQLAALAARLARMAPHEAAIRKIVTGQ